MFNQLVVRMFTTKLLVADDRSWSQVRGEFLGHNHSLDYSARSGYAGSVFYTGKISLATARAHLTKPKRSDWSNAKQDGSLRSRVQKQLEVTKNAVLDTQNKHDVKS